MPRLLAPAIAALVFPLLSACAGPPPVGEASSPIIGGTADDGDPAIVLLVAYPPDKSTLDTCTGVLISPTVILTAAHCVDPANHPGYLYGAFLGADASAYDTIDKILPELAAVKSTAMHPMYDPKPPFHADLGVAVLSEALTVEPLPIQRTALDAKIVGQPARIAGYGQTVYGTFNLVKHQASTVVASLGGDDTVVVGDGTKHSCVGDSGGPALVKIDGVETVIGLDSYTETTGCVEPASYRRPDVYLGFIDSFAPPPPPDAGTDGGGGGSGGAGGAGGGSAGGTSSHGCAAAGGGAGGTAAAAILLALGAAIGARRRRR